jgi:predicted ABC-type transport system involved in lysophospholipase L1 biosynthesis ATPase subunit
LAVRPGPPRLLLADAPSGKLDSRSGGAGTALFLGLNDQGLTMVVVRPHAGIARHCRRVVRAADGRIRGDDAEAERARATETTG